MRSATSIAIATVLGLGSLTTGVVVSPASGATVTACVKKKTGEVRITKKKCKKGWKRASWNTQGSTGPQGSPGSQGPAGPTFMVKDANGTVGQFLGMFPIGINIFFVLVNGGSYSYTPDGRVYPIGLPSPHFTAPDCSGQAFIKPASPEAVAQLVGVAGGPTRIVWRQTTPTFGPTLAWTVTPNTQNINQAVYKRNESGACVADGNHSGAVVLLQPTTPPADATPPLTIG